MIFSLVFVCNRGDTILCSRRAPANKRKLGQVLSMILHKKFLPIVVSIDWFRALF